MAGACGISDNSGCFKVSRRPLSQDLSTSEVLTVNQFDFKDFLQTGVEYLSQHRFELAIGIGVAVALCLLVVLVYFFRKAAERPAVSDTRPASVVTAKIPRAAPKEAKFLQVPEDSTLKRHYVTHVRSMIETLTLPRPTDSVLRRHYDHLIASELEACLTDEARMKKLIVRFEQHRRDAFNRRVPCTQG